MAFLCKMGNLLKQSMGKHISSEISASNPSILQAIRCMSSSKLFIGGLSYSTDDTSLREAFNAHGEVIEARVIMDRETGRSRGFGFVTFTSSEEASSAINAMDGQDLHGRMVRVNYATDRAGGFRSGGGGYGGGGGGYGGGGYGGGDSYGGSGGGSYGGSGGGSYGSGGGSYGSGGGGYGNSGGFGGGSGGFGGSSNVATGGSDNYAGGGGGGGAGADGGFASGSGSTGGMPYQGESVGAGAYSQAEPMEDSLKRDDGEPADDYANRRS